MRTDCKPLHSRGLQQRNHTTTMGALRLCILFAVVVIIPANADRSFYAPRPFNYPGLLPRFGEEDNSPSSTTTTTQRPIPQRPIAQNPQFTGDSNSLGNRFGGNVIRVNPNTAPCYECFLYVTRDGYVIRVKRD